MRAVRWWGRLALGVAGLGLGLPSAGRAAPMGPGVETVTVMAIEADLVNDLASKTLTNALRQQVLDSTEYTVSGESPSLLVKAGEAKCSLKGLGRPLHEGSDLTFDKPCLKRLGTLLGARRYFWGHLYNVGSRPFVKLHLWQDGIPDRSVTLPYEGTGREGVAERLYRKLVTPEMVGDVVVLGAPSLEGELFVDGKGRGAFKPRLELTLTSGEHAFEVRRGNEALARVKVRITAGQWSEAHLEPVRPGQPPLAAVEAPVSEPPPIYVRPARTAWPWVLGGVGVAGLAGAGVLYGLRSGQESDLDDLCTLPCPTRARDTLDRSNLYGTLSFVSLSVGIAALTGSAALFVYEGARRERLAAGPGAPGAAQARNVGSTRPQLVGAISPLAGGAAATISGSFLGW
jgi:hypothetical protein